MRWRAWFTGGRVFDSADVAWECLPDDGVLVVVQFHADGTSRFCAGDDFYWLLPDGSVAHNSDRLEDNERRYPGAVFKRGQWTTEAELRAAIDAATAATGAV